ncbi:MAG: hypothetical protein MHM6MM_002203 [Cercozoa sp. M6MM]
MLGAGAEAVREYSRDALHSASVCSSCGAKDAAEWSQDAGGPVCRECGHLHTQSMAVGALDTAKTASGDLVDTGQKVYHGRAHNQLLGATAQESKLAVSYRSYSDRARPEIFKELKHVMHHCGIDDRRFLGIKKVYERCFDLYRDGEKKIATYGFGRKYRHMCAAAVLVWAKHNARTISFEQVARLFDESEYSLLRRRVRFALKHYFEEGAVQVQPEQALQRHGRRVLRQLRVLVGIALPGDDDELAMARKDDEMAAMEAQQGGLLRKEESLGYEHEQLRERTEELLSMAVELDICGGRLPAAIACAAALLASESLRLRPRPEELCRRTCAPITTTRQVEHDMRRKLLELARRFGTFEDPLTAQKVPQHLHSMLHCWRQWASMDVERRKRAHSLHLRILLSAIMQLRKDKLPGRLTALELSEIAKMAVKALQPHGLIPLAMTPHTESLLKQACLLLRLGAIRADEVASLSFDISLKAEKMRSSLTSMIGAACVSSESRAAKQEVFEIPTDAWYTPSEASEEERQEWHRIAQKLEGDHELTNVVNADAEIQQRAEVLLKAKTLQPYQVSGVYSHLSEEFRNKYGIEAGMQPPKKRRITRKPRTRAKRKTKSGETTATSSDASAEAESDLAQLEERDSKLLWTKEDMRLQFVSIADDELFGLTPGGEAPMGPDEGA